MSLPLRQDLCLRQLHYFRPSNSARKLRLRSNGHSFESPPPIPPLSLGPDEQLMKIDTNLEEMDGIVDRNLYYGGSDASSPSSDISHSESGQSCSQVEPLQFNSPLLQSPLPTPRVTDIKANARTNFDVPQSWAVNLRDPEESDEDCSSDDDGGGAQPNTTTSFPRWKIRVYGPDNSAHILRVSITDTVADLAPRLNLKLPATEERETHELYLKERGRGASTFVVLLFWRQAVDIHYRTNIESPRAPCEHSSTPIASGRIR